MPLIIKMKNCFQQCIKGKVPMMNDKEVNIARNYKNPQGFCYLVECDGIEIHMHIRIHGGIGEFYHIEDFEFPLTSPFNRHP
jgi:hypothetical protein